jgi:hypothetical protein
VWEAKLGEAGSVTLMPLPGGGIVASFRQKIFGFSAAGTLLWERDSAARAFDWVLSDERLVFSTIGEGGSMWTADEAGLVAATEPTSGHLVVVDDQVLVLGTNGVYRLDLEALSVDLLYALPKGLLERMDMVALPDGGVLLTHVNTYDRRLIALNGDGTLRWQRSFARSIQGQEHRLLVMDGRPYFVSSDRSAASNGVAVHAVDADGARLTRVFVASGRNPRREGMWVSATGDGRLLLSVSSGTGSGSIIALDTGSALEAVLQAMGPEMRPQVRPEVGSQ